MEPREIPPKIYPKYPFNNHPDPDDLDNKFMLIDAIAYQALKEKCESLEKEVARLQWLRSLGTE